MSFIKDQVRKKSTWLKVNLENVPFYNRIDRAKHMDYGLLLWMGTRLRRSNYLYGSLD